ncbi:MAG: phenylalanine--tRNA ligase subunit alpha [Bacilli bacterium]
MIEKIQTILATGLKAIESAKDLHQLQEVRNTYLAKKSELMGIFSLLKDLGGEEKKQVGLEINQARDQLTKALDQKQQTLQQAVLLAKLKEEVVDISQPASNVQQGSVNPFFIVEQAITDVFIAMGYQVAEGPEIESDHYNFELLNIPKDHPAREMQDSLYFDDNTLMRTHTSPVQARVMQAAKGQPIQVICPGKVYRRDEDDATHSHQFGQVEGLVVSEGINLGHLKQTLQAFAKKMFGEKREIRLRPSFFPFTEPSVEIDVSCFECGGKGCNLCKHTGWIEILGGGMVHPRVLSMNGYDSKRFTGFAFGIGIERVAMLRYGIDDIRRFYQNDLRFIQQFKRK